VLWGTLAAAQPEAQPASADLVVLLVPQGLAAQPLEAIVEIGIGESEEVIRRTVGVPGKLELSDLGDFPWRIQVRAPGTWSHPVVVTEPPPTALRIPVWPAARLQAEIRPLAGSPVPQSIGVRLQRPQGAVGGFGLDQVDQVCPLTSDGVLDCAAPAVPLDLRLRVPGFASRFFRDRDLSGQEALDLGTVVLRPGASVVGTVEVPVGYDVAGVQARLDPSHALAEVRLATDNLFQDVAVSIDERGFFAFEGLRPGLYRLRLTHPELAALQMEPVRVVEGSQTRIDRVLSLQPPATLKVVVEPGFDPYDGDWRVELFELSGPPPHRRQPGAKGTTQAGFFEAEDVPPAPHEVVISDSKGMRVATETVNDAANLNLLKVEVRPIWVVGQVSLGDEPVIAELTFRGPVRGPRRGPSNVTLETDSEGAYGGYLAEDGIWDVEVEGLMPPVRWRSAEVEVESEDGRAEVDFRLPDTEITGVVEKSTGELVRGANIVVVDEVGAGRRIQAKSQAEGVFSLHGLEEGRYRVQAAIRVEDEVWSAQSNVIQVMEGFTPKLRLILQRKKLLTGRVVDSAGRPVAQAWIEVRPWRGPYPDLMNGSSVVSGPEGRFEDQLPAGTTAVRLVVLVPGYALRSVEAPMGDVGEIGLSSESGTLVAELPEEVPWGEPAKPRPFLIDANGVVHYLGSLVRWAQMNGQQIQMAEPLRSIEVPLLPPGRYSLCWMGARDAYDPGRRGRGCVEGELTPGSRLVLNLAPLPSG